VKKTVRPAGGIYQNLLNDFGFKHVFRQQKFLIAFLNELLNGVEKIETVEYLNSEHLGKTEQDRYAVFDILCSNANADNTGASSDAPLRNPIAYPSSSLNWRSSRSGRWNDSASEGALGNRNSNSPSVVLDSMGFRSVCCP
jgi:hypothetical protein